VRVVRDEEDAIVGAVRALSDAYDYVFSTGGIGPTHDDITAASMAKAFGVKLEMNAGARQQLAEYCAARDIPLNEGRLRMIRIPAGATLIGNPVSAAPGFRVKNVFVMAGVPKIMQGMFIQVEPSLAQGTPLLVNTITGSLRESDIALEMEAIQNQYPEVEIGSYPMMGGHEPSVSLVLRSADEKKLKTATDKILAMVKRIDADAAAAYQRP
jgi:molybdopterin-biosynthesis enzyme MoeA-like protein